MRQLTIGGGARAEAAKELEIFGVKIPELMDYILREPVGIEGMPRPGGVEVVVRLEAGRGCEGENDLAAKTGQVIGRAVEGISELRGEGLYQEGSVVRHMPVAATGAAAARPWSFLLDTLGN